MSLRFEGTKFLINFSFPRLKRIKMSNFTSGWVQYRVGRYVNRGTLVAYDIHFYTAMRHPYCFICVLYKHLHKYSLLYKLILIRFDLQGVFVSISKSPFGISPLNIIHQCCLIDQISKSCRLLN